MSAKEHGLPAVIRKPVVRDPGNVPTLGIIHPDTRLKILSGNSGTLGARKVFEPPTKTSVFFRVCFLGQKESA
jgi:hypothetical protein